MPNPTRSEVHVSTALTNVAISYFEDNPGVAMQVFPVVPVTKSTNTYFKWNLNDLLRITAEVRAPGSPSAGTGFRLTKETYSTLKYALHSDLDWDTIEEADDALSLESGVTTALMMNVRKKFEKVWGDANFVPAVWAHNKDGSGADFIQWDTGSSTPIIDIRTFKREVQSATGFMPNTITFGALVWDTLIDHADLLDRIKATGTGGTPAVITKQMVAEILEIETVLVGDMIHATNVEGGTAATAQILDPKGVLISYSSKTPSIVLPSAGYTFSRKGRTVPDPSGVSTKRFDIEENEATRIEVQGDWDHKLTSTDLALFMEKTLS